MPLYVRDSIPACGFRRASGRVWLAPCAQDQTGNSFSIAVLLDGESSVKQFPFGVSPLRGFGAIYGKHQKDGKPPNSFLWLAVLINLVPVPLIPRRTGDVGITAFIFAGSGSR